jgi:hypothetical protein
LPRERAVAVRSTPLDREIVGNRHDRTYDLLRRPRKRSAVRTIRFRCKQLSFYRRYPAGLARVRLRSGVTQTHQPTDRRKKTCKCRPPRKRLEGFEPSTFCMASSADGSRSARISPANARVLGCGCRFVMPRLSPGNHGSLGSEWVVEPAGSVLAGSNGRPHDL